MNCDDGCAPVGWVPVSEVLARGRGTAAVGNRGASRRSVHEWPVGTRSGSSSTEALASTSRDRAEHDERLGSRYHPIG